MKKIHRFLIGNIPSGTTITLDESRCTHQVLQVLKMTVGEPLIIFTDGGPDILTTITTRTKNTITLEKQHTIDPIATPKTVIAAVAIAKGQTFELVVQKLTELGVTTIVPIITTRTVKQSVRIERLQTISDEALEQSGGNKRVTIHEPTTLAACLTEFPFPSIAFQAGSDTAPLPTDSTVVLYIGPEGGWSEEDITLLDSNQVIWKSLGTHTLRTETAAIVGTYTILWQ